jgi:hypothetical protein
MERIEVENRLRQLQDHPQDFGHNLPPDDRRVVMQQRLVDKLSGDLQRLRERSETRAAAWQAASGALANVETWLKSGRPGNTVLETVETEPPKLAKNEAGLLDAVENRRRRVRELRADQHRIQSAPFPSAYAKAQMRRQIEQLAERGTPSVARLVELDGKIEFATTRLTSEIYGEQRQLGFAEVPDAVALTCWLHRDLLISKLDAEIDTESDDSAALSHTDRELRSAEIQGDLVDTERQEASLVFAAWEHGLACEHRSDCSPVALLGLRLVTTPHAEQPGTTPGSSRPMPR